MFDRIGRPARRIDLTVPTSFRSDIAFLNFRQKFLGRDSYCLMKKFSTQDTPRGLVKDNNYIITSACGDLYKVDTSRFSRTISNEIEPQLYEPSQEGGTDEITASVIGRLDQ